MLDTEPLYQVAWQATSAELGYALDDTSYATLIGRPTDDCERERRWFGPGFPLDRFRVRWPELWQAEVAANGIQQKPGLLEILTFADAQRLPVAVATSSEADYAAFSLRHAALEGRFNVIVTRDQVARGKPAPDLYLETARRLQVEPGGVCGTRGLGGWHPVGESCWHACAVDPGRDAPVGCGGAGGISRGGITA